MLEGLKQPKYFDLSGKLESKLRKCSTGVWYIYILIIVRICFLNQITQLKIASNPFAKGFRDCDPDDWYVSKTIGFSQPFSLVEKVGRHPLSTMLRLSFGVGA